jgi:hypothetical protein
MNPSTPFETLIGRLDTALFEPIESQTSREDRLSFLAVERAVRERLGSYVYLEIGSYLGGSLQPHLRDDRCRKVYSIDKRPVEPVPDDRANGSVYHYRDNSTERMLELLRGDAQNQLSKLVCFDSDAVDLDPGQFADAPDVCLIDGEHTHRAVLSDFRFCRSVVKADGVVLFHDRLLLHRAIIQILADLKRDRVRHRGMPLGGQVYAIGLGDAPVLDDPELQAMASRQAEFNNELRYYRLSDTYERLVPGWCRAALRPASSLFRVRLLGNRWR